MSNPMSLNDRLPIALLSLRLGVVIVMVVWVLDKFVNPAHGAAVFEHFYLVSGVSTTVVQVVGAVQALIVLGFALGFRKRITYGLVLAMHLISTLSSYKVYLDPWAISEHPVLGRLADAGRDLRSVLPARPGHAADRRARTLSAAAANRRPVLRRSAFMAPRPG